MPDSYPREQLCQIIERYGQAIVYDVKLCKNLLNDFAPQYRLEIHLLIAALEQRVVEQLLKPTALTPIHLQLERLAQSLRDANGIEAELAYWAVESWALALKIINEPLARPIVPIEPYNVNEPSYPPVKKSNTKLLWISICLIMLTMTVAGFAWLNNKPATSPKPMIEPTPLLEKPTAQIENLPVPNNIERAEDAWTQNNLGDLYYYGYKVPQSHQQAVYWYRKAAEQGNATGQCNLAYMYAHGYGVTKDYPQAAYWYRRAAEQGDAEGQNNLGIMYENGYGVAKDKQQAITWYSRAVEQGHYGAQLKLRKLVK